MIEPPIIIREIEESDAQSFLDLCNQLDAESDYRLYEPGERKTTVDKQRQIIHEFLAWDNSTIFVAERLDRLVGYIAAQGGKFHRNRHNANIVISVLQHFSGRGVGTQLLIEVEHWALEREIHRLELTVMAHNKSAINLYKKMGFEVEGVRIHALCVDSVYIDELMMARLLA